MARLISICPKCGQKNEVKNNVYMRGDRGARVTCQGCSKDFCAKLNNKDIEELFEEGSIIPVVKGEEDYILESICYPS